AGRCPWWGRARRAQENRFRASGPVRPASADRRRPWGAAARRASAGRRCPWGGPGRRAGGGRRGPVGGAGRTGCGGGGRRWGAVGRARMPLVGVGPTGTGRSAISGGRGSAPDGRFGAGRSTTSRGVGVGPTGVGRSVISSSGGGSGTGAETCAAGWAALAALPFFRPFSSRAGGPPTSPPPAGGITIICAPHPEHFIRIPQRGL